MTIETWKKEFYTKDAKSKMTKRQAVEHSIKKWNGLTKANLKKHLVFKDNFSNQIYDNEINWFSINDESCALCVKYYEGALDEGCEKCPLFVSLGRPCANPSRFSPYDDYYKKSNPSKMIKVLEETLEKIISGEIK